MKGDEWMTEQKNIIVAILAVLLMGTAIYGMYRISVIEKKHAEYVDVLQERIDYKKDMLDIHDKETSKALRIILKGIDLPTGMTLVSEGGSTFSTHDVTTLFNFTWTRNVPVYTNDFITWYGLTTKYARIISKTGYYELKGVNHTHEANDHIFTGDFDYVRYRVYIPSRGVTSIWTKGTVK